MSDAETIAVYDRECADYARMTQSDARDRQLAKFIAAMAPRARVLDLGCGPGTAAHVMADAGLEVDATDASREMVALAAAHPGVTAWQATFDEIAGEDLYDGIWANFCLLHAPRAAIPTHLKAIAKALKPGGRFHIGVKLGSGEERDSVGRLYTYFAEDELEGLLAGAGLSVVDRARGRSSGLSGEMSDWIVMQAHA